jgi:tetratricopeptide (TPR) repeat protein
MKYIKEQGLIDADDASDTQVSTVLYEARVAELQEKMLELPPNYDPLEKAELQVAIGALLLELERDEEAFDTARQAFDVYLAAENWHGAVRACDIMFLADQPESLAALGQGIWLAVTFPEVEPELTVSMLNHVVDETPDDSDGAALAAAVARYVVDLRTEGKTHENLAFYANQMLGEVARRHSNVSSQETFDFWIQRLELDKPEVFLPRMREVIDVLVERNWWFDTDALQARLPVN